MDGGIEWFAAKCAVVRIGPKLMVFPVVEDTATSSETGLVTSHTVDLPAGIVANELLIGLIHAHSRGDVCTFTWPGGWTELLDFQIAGSSEAMSVAYRLADGTEGASIEVTTTGLGRRSSHSTYRLSGIEDPATQAPEVSAGATGSSTTPNPDEATPTGGAKDYLWLAVAGIRGKTATIPTNYTDRVQIIGSVEQTSITSARRELNAASENPGTFTIVQTSWLACTVAIHPGAFPIPPAGGWGWDWQWSKFKIPERAAT